MARYWVGGTGNWSDITHWSTSSGGAGGESEPDFSQDVFFDGNSGTGTCSASGNISCLKFTAISASNISISLGSSFLSIYDIFNWDGTNTINFGTGTINISTASVLTWIFPASQEINDLRFGLDNIDITFKDTNNNLTIISVRDLNVRQRINGHLSSIMIRRNLVADLLDIPNVSVTIDNLKFSVGTTHIITAGLTILFDSLNSGTSSNIITLRKTASGNVAAGGDDAHYLFNSSSPLVVSFYDLKECKGIITSGSTYDAVSSVNSGNNVNWNFNSNYFLQTIQMVGA